jgi:hypothetical protein
VVKIGWTANLAGQLRALATASAAPLELLAAVPGDRREVQEHRRWRPGGPEILLAREDVRRPPGPGYLRGS